MSTRVLRLGLYACLRLTTTNNRIGLYDYDVNNKCNTNYVSVIPGAGAVVAAAPFVAFVAFASAENRNGIALTALL